MRTARIALREQFLDDHVERYVLAGVGSERDSLRSPDQFTKTRIAREVGSKGQRVREEADHSLRLQRRSSRDRCADGEIDLPRMPVQDGFEAGKKRHEQRRALAASEGLDLIDERLRPILGPLSTSTARDRPGPVGREFQGGNARECFTPERELSLQ